MIMIIAIIYMFIILWDNWSIVENYLQKILSPPEKIYSPLKVQKVQVPPFCQHWKFFRPPCRKGGRTLLSNFTKHNQMIHDPMMQDSCINFVFLYVSWTDWCKKQPTLHWKHHWIIQIGFDLFLVEQKPDKITYIFLLPMHISFNNQSSFLFRQLICTIHIQSRYRIGEFFTNIICIALACSERYSYDTRHNYYTFVCMLFLYWPGMFQKKHMWHQA